MFWANFKINNTPWLAACLFSSEKITSGTFCRAYWNCRAPLQNCHQIPLPPTSPSHDSIARRPGKAAASLGFHSDLTAEAVTTAMERVGDGNTRVHDIGPMPHQAADGETRGHGLAFQQGYDADSYIDRPRRRWQSWNRQPTSLLKFRTSIQAIRPLTASVSIHET